MHFSTPSMLLKYCLMAIVTVTGLLGMNRIVAAQFGGGSSSRAEADPINLPQALLVIERDLIVPVFDLLASLKGRASAPEDVPAPEAQQFLATMPIPVDKLSQVKLFLHAFDEEKPPVAYTILRTPDRIPFDKIKDSHTSEDLFLKPLRYQNRSWIATSWRSVVSTESPPETLRPFIQYWNREPPQHPPIPSTYAPDGADLYVFLKFGPLRERATELRHRFPALFHTLKDEATRELAKSIETASFKLWNGVEGDQTIITLRLSFVNPTEAAEAGPEVEELFAKVMKFLPAASGEVARVRQQLLGETQVQAEGYHVSLRTPVKPADFFRQIAPAMGQWINPPAETDQGENLPADGESASD